MNSGRCALLSMGGAIALTAALAACGGSGGGTSTGTSTSTSTSTSGTAVATYTIGGSIAGLTDLGLILANGNDVVSPNAGDTSFTFPAAVASGTTYAVSAQLQPDGLTCTVADGSGVVGAANVTGVEVNCTASLFSIGGVISGLSGAGLVLANGTDRVDPTVGASAFTFPTKLPTATSFDVTVMTQPSGQTCQVSNGTGVILTSAVTNVSVDCK